VYETASGTRSLKYIVTPEGRAVKSGSSWDYEFNLKDHLGNVRAVIRKGSNGLAELIQQKHYYPFGMEMSQLNLGTGTNKYLYNGKELQDDFELGWYDYGARFYDPELGRFHSVDPKSEEYFPQSPYAYAANNPILFIDRNGEDPYLIFNGAQSQLTIYDDGDTPDNYTDDVLVGTYDAHNNVASNSKGKWEDGEYDMQDQDSPHMHPDQKDAKGVLKDSKNGAYGENGIFRAKSFTETSGKKQKRTGMGIHAGRENKSFKDRKTMGCIRTTAEGMKGIKKAIKDYGSLKKVIVQRNKQSTNSKKVNKIDPTAKKIEPKKPEKVEL
ncbi:MAG: RHS repeat domain-containing protein, partial [Bacteroidota bacterium]